MLHSQSCSDIAEGLLIGLISEGISPIDRERILRIALRAAQALNARIARQQRANGAAPAGDDPQ